MQSDTFIPILGPPMKYYLFKGRINSTAASQMCADERMGIYVYMCGVAVFRVGSYRLFGSVCV